MNVDSKTILLVDDEPWLTEALAFSLEARGFACLTATDVTSAVRTLEANSVAVLVTDIMMPPGERFKAIDAAEAGFYFIDYVKKEWPKIPIICLSVIGDQAKIKSLIKRNVRYLRKGETPLSTALEVISAVATGRKIRIK